MMPSKTDTSAISNKMYLIGDTDKLELIQSPQYKPVSLTSTMSFGIFQDQNFVKMLEVARNYNASDRSLIPDEPRVAEMADEIAMMQAAASAGCSFPPLGRVVLNDVVIGFITNLGIIHPKTFDQHIFFQQREALLGGPSFFYPSAKEFIDGVVALVHRLHANGVVHGDIKPANILYCKDTRGFVLCDFDSARYLGSTERQVGPSTIHYNTPARAGGGRHPLAVEDDLYALGITVWEIASGKEKEYPFFGIDENYVEDFVAAGFQPNLYEVEDVDTHRLIRSLLDAAGSTTDLRPTSACITADVAYDECHASPPHTYMKKVHCPHCTEGAKCATDPGQLCHATSTLSHMEMLPCPSCHLN